MAIGPDDSLSKTQDDCQFELVDGEWIKFEDCDSNSNKLCEESDSLEGQLSSPVEVTHDGNTTSFEPVTGRLMRYPCSSPTADLVAQLQFEEDVTIADAKLNHVAVVHRQPGGIVRIYVRAEDLDRQILAPVLSDAQRAILDKIGNDFLEDDEIVLATQQAIDAADEESRTTLLIRATKPLMIQ